MACKHEWLFDPGIILFVNLDPAVIFLIQPSDGIPDPLSVVGLGCSRCTAAIFNVALQDLFELIGADEGGDLYGNIETGTQIYIRTARNKVRTITIDLNCDLSGYEDSDTIFTDVIFCERKEWIGIEERSSA